MRDDAGRIDAAKEAEIMSLAPAGATSLLAEVFFAGVSAEADKAATYAVEGSTESAKKAQRRVPFFAQHPDVLPIRTLRAALHSVVEEPAR